MIIKATDRSTYLDVSKIEWEPTKYPGVDIKFLYKDPSGRQTTLTRMAPGAKLPMHRHTGIEQSYVLEGTLVDDDGACTAGNYVWRRAGSVHDAWTPDGCLVLGIFETPNEFLPQRGLRPASRTSRRGTPSRPSPRSTARTAPSDPARRTSPGRR